MESFPQTLLVDYVLALALILLVLISTLAVLAIRDRRACRRHADARFDADDDCGSALRGCAG